MPVDFQHADYKSNIGIWNNIDDAVDKKNLTRHLRELNPCDTSKDNKSRNENYKRFAVFYGFASFTLAGLIGELYSKDPEIDLPPGLEYLNENSDGHGNSITQLSQSSSRETTKKGRAGLFTSFPSQQETVSRADILRGVRAIITPIDANRIINWEESTVNGVNKLTLVVMSETMGVVGADGFSVVNETVYREIRLREGVYFDRKWAKNKKTGDWDVIEGSEKIPLDGSGQPWDILPFKFIGSQNNDSTVDRVNMSDLAEINLAHFRNSADFEDSVWYSGQAQPWMSGLDQNMIEIMKENNVYTGGRQLMPVPEGEKFGYASADPNPVVRQAMLDKVDLAMAMGARFIQPGGVAKTASQSNSETKSSNSVIGLIGKNVSDAYRDSIKFVARYMGVPDDNVRFNLNNDFLPDNATAQDVKEMVSGWMVGAVPSDDYIRYMQDIGRFDSKKSVEDYREELDQNA